MIVYLLHFHPPAAGDPSPPHLAHFLGVASSEASIDLRVMPHGAGLRRIAPGGAEGVLVDVWEAADEAGAWAKRDQLARQGSRARLCSICNPGNGRGAGRGQHWREKRAIAQAAEPQKGQS